MPVYPLTEGLTQRWLRGTMKRRAGGRRCTWSTDPLPAGLRARHALPPLPDGAARATISPHDEAAKAAAVRRLAFDELLYMSIGMARRKRAWQHGAPAHADPARRRRRWTRFMAALPFALTGAQRARARRRSWTTWRGRSR